MPSMSISLTFLCMIRSIVRRYMSCLSLAIYPSTVLTGAHAVQTHNNLITKRQQIGTTLKSNLCKLPSPTNMYKGLRTQLNRLRRVAFPVQGNRKHTTNSLLGPDKRTVNDSLFQHSGFYLPIGRKGCLRYAHEIKTDIIFILE